MAEERVYKIVATVASVDEANNEMKRLRASGSGDVQGFFYGGVGRPVKVFTIEPSPDDFAIREDGIIILPELH